MKLKIVIAGEQKVYLFGWTNFKWFVVEMIRTFSNKPSYFARKRIESFVLFLNAMVLLDVWYIKSFEKIDYVSALGVFTAQMIYAGYQVAQIRKDVVANAAIENGTGTTESTTEVTAESTTESTTTSTTNNKPT